MQHTTRTARSTVLRAALAAVLLTGAAFLAACGGEEPAEQTQPEQSTPATEQPAQSPDASAPQGMEEVTELKIEDLQEGTGAEATAGKNVTVHYTGWLTDGTKFDSSLDSGQPFTFALGSGQVIPGWDQGVEGMKVGGKRRLTIPPQLAYGEQGAPPVIPPNATLVFDVELLNVQ